MSFDFISGKLAVTNNGEDRYGKNQILPGFMFTRRLFWVLSFHVSHIFLCAFYIAPRKSFLESIVQNNINKFNVNRVTIFCKKGTVILKSELHSYSALIL